MKSQKINRVDFSDIFHYAEKKFKVDWNRANDMFFNHSLDYKSFNEYGLGEPLDYIDKDKKYNDLSEEDKGYYIINDYMIDNKLEDIFINNR